MKSSNRRCVAWLGFLIVASICLLTASCGGDVTPKIVAGVDGCEECSMVIDRLNEACGWIHNDEFVAFCSPGCLLARHDVLRASGEELPGAVFFADYEGAGFLHSSETAFLLTNHIPTVMNAQVVCFSSIAAAEEMKNHDDEIVTDWTGYRVERGQPDTIVETVFSPNGMHPEAVTVAKGDIVLWRATGANLTQDLEWTIAGYPEVAPAPVPTTGEAIEVRILAIRPGAGFPIQDLASQRALGMLKVTGAHTADEAAQ